MFYYIFTSHCSQNPANFRWLWLTELAKLNGLIHTRFSAGSYSKRTNTSNKHNLCAHWRLVYLKYKQVHWYIGAATWISGPGYNTLSLRVCVGPVSDGDRPPRHHPTRPRALHDSMSNACMWVHQSKAQGLMEWCCYSSINNHPTLRENPPCTAAYAWGA